MNHQQIKRKITGALTALTLAGCAGLERSCLSDCAQASPADWVVVQYDGGGKPINCWQLRYTKICNEPASDGIYWQDIESDHVVHISGWYNRVQVHHEHWKEAAESIGISLENCANGKYR